MINCCKNHQCSRCGECCSPNIPFTKKELKVIKEYLETHPDICEEANNNKLIDGENVYIKCTFFKDNKCLIYPVRPLICRQFKCDQCESTMEQNRDAAHKRADYNRIDDLSTITDFRYLLFDDPRILVYSIAYYIGTRDVEKIKRFLDKIGLNDISKRLVEKEGDNNEPI